MVTRRLAKIAAGLWLLLWLPAMPLSAEVATSVDRQVLTETDVLMFELTFTEVQTFDFDVLKDNFEILNRQQGFQLRFDADMEPERVHSWRLLLQPRRRGDLTIPAFGSGDSRSHPISIRVNPATADSEADRARLAFMEASLSETEVFVQQAFYYRLRVYYRADGVLFGELPPGPRIDSAIVQPVGDTRRGRTQVDDRDYRFLERRYLVVPQESGTLRLPPETFTGAVRVDDAGQPRRRNLHLDVARRQIEVRPQPPEWPDGHPWLPARNLELRESLDADNAMAGFGIPLARTVTLRAEDTPASLMPALDWAPDSHPDLNHYPQRPELNEQMHNGRLQATRSETTTLLAERALTVSLPAISVYWWDLDTNNIREALLPSRTLPIGSSEQAQLPKPDDATTAPAEDSAAASSPERQLQLSPVLMALYLAAALAIGLAFWVAARLLPIHRFNVLWRHTPWQTREQRLYRELLAACKRHDAASARQLLTAWLSSRVDLPATAPSNRLVAAADQASLQPLLATLDASLYGQAQATWDGRPLRHWVQRHRRSQRTRAARRQAALPALYPHQ